MVPSTTAAVVVFLLMVAPGIAFELLWQTTRLRREESTFVEISRVLFTGVVFSGVAVTLVAVLGAVVPGAAADLPALLRDTAKYVAANPVLTLISLVAVVLLALCFAVATHDLLTPDAARRILQETAWHNVFDRLAVPGVRVFLSVQLKDGTTITGYSAGYSTESDPAKRDLVLTAPLSIRQPEAEEAEALEEDWQTLVLPGAEIRTIAAAYVGSPEPVRAAGPARRFAGFLMRHAWQTASCTALLILVALLVSGLVRR
ncbi:DUF6338 family protein [Amycolatopsis sp. NPDC059021]|uniref:DUF6338 family protein n=1 Tax=Amycolatopsis sp. NPDC059021 TaxID=3346704 RepID=UPI003672B1DC